jgi:glycosyltransferase involved in cell wall biosynthesis
VYNPLLTIVTVNYKTADFIDLMLYSFEQLTFNSYKVIICDNYSSDKEIIRLAKVVQKYSNVEVIFRKQTAFGSVGHAEAMDLLVSKVNTPYFVTMDSDAVFLSKHWDKNIILKIDDTIKVIGTTLPPSRNSIKPMDFPLVFAVLYETKTYQKLNPSFMPGNLKEDKSKDTGWEIREKYLENNFSSIVFESKNTRFSHDTPFEQLMCAVYYFNDELIASHFSRGSSVGNAKYNNKWWLKIPKLSKIFRYFIGLKEKREWINKCTKIIEEKI